MNMVYVLSREEDDKILILPFLPLAINKDDEEEDRGEKLLYEFPWDYNSTLPCLRWFVLDYSEEKGSVYLPAVLDYLDTIKDLQKPPQEELKRVYQVKSKIDAFLTSLLDLEKIGLISRPDSYTLTDQIIYETDLYSQYYRELPSSLVDLVLAYQDLSGKTKDGIAELWKTKNVERQEELRDTLNIPSEFLPLPLKIKAGSGKREVPEFLCPDPLVKEEIGKKEKAMIKFRETYGLGDIIDSKVLSDLGLSVPEISQYFELSRDWRNKTYKIIRIL